MTWKSHSIPALEDYFVESVEFANSRIGVISGQRRVGVGSYVERITLITEDGGKQWRTLRLPDAAFPQSLTFGPKNTLWAVGRVAEVYSSDLTGTWRENGEKPGTGFLKIHWLTDRRGWAFGDEIYETSDGGRTWTKDEISLQFDGAISQLLVVDEKNALALNAYGAILIKTPLIAGWKLVNLGDR